MLSVSTAVVSVMAPLLDVAVSPLPPRPVDVITPAPVIVLAAAELVFSDTPPLAVTAPATTMLLLLVSVKEPAPSVTDEREMLRPN